MISRIDITGGEVAGAGFYDELMRTTRAQLVEEFEANRLVGAEYATVVLGSMQANLQTASSFILAYESQNAQLLIQAEQLQSVELDNQLKEDQLLTAALQRELLTEQIETQKQQTLQLVEQTKLVTKQLDQADKQIELMDKQIIQLEGQITLTARQEEMVEQQIITEKTNTEDPTAGMAKATFDKTNSEVSILNQKLVTEKAQTEGTTDTVEGLLGREMNLKTIQAESFLRDAEQKAAKFYADVLSIAYSVDSTNTDPALWNLGPTEASYVMSTLMAGIGITSSTLPADPTPYEG